MLIIFAQKQNVKFALLLRRHTMESLTRVYTDDASRNASLNNGLPPSTHRMSGPLTLKRPSVHAQWNRKLSPLAPLGHTTDIRAE